MPKEHTGSFYLEEWLLDALSALAHEQGISRSQLVENMIVLFLKEECRKKG
ncbi:hypothetical protein NHP190002_05520 [Helicobacter ailurogastricus]|uniref:ribbon-helix-helix domain-containing protein n=1 Tax=Helicobacter ailurogastricus TaxID=1578720 RepID=UPI00244D7F68|nr:ribbon-helix-helix domain-containing protein [Helicobacter ailurogastricus]GMB89873.1 hypothetical protein NHP190002_05520 [Helicobacter ailurogastricus]